MNDSNTQAEIDNDRLASIQEDDFEYKKEGMIEISRELAKAIMSGHARAIDSFGRRRDKSDVITAVTEDEQFTTSIDKIYSDATNAILLKELIKRHSFYYAAVHLLGEDMADRLMEEI